MRLPYAPFLILAALAGTVMAEAEPNVVLILADDLSATALPAYGGTSAKTPVLDGLAAASRVSQRRRGHTIRRGHSKGHR